MKIRYIGHSCFLFETQAKKTILIDPFEEKGATPLALKAHIVLCSHGHRDHSNLKMLSGPTTVITGAGNHDTGGVKITGYTADHGTVEGRWLGMVVCYSVEADGIRCLHLSDIGVMPTDSEIEAFGSPHILFVPVGGHFTIDGEKAAQLVERINPRIAIPMHYAVPGMDRLRCPIDGPEKFTRFFKKTEFQRKNQIEISIENLPDYMKILILNPEI